MNYALSQDGPRSVQMQVVQLRAHVRVFRAQRRRRRPGSSRAGLWGGKVDVVDLRQQVLGGRGGRDTERRDPSL